MVFLMPESRYYYNACQKFKKKKLIITLLYINFLMVEIIFIVLFK